MYLMSIFGFLYSIPLLSPDRDLMDIFLAIIQGFTLIFLVMYVKKTWDMAVATEKSVDVSKLTLQEMKATRDQEISPYVVAYFEFIGHDIYLIIENVGKGLAKNVNCDIKPELKSNKIKSNDNLSFIKDGIASMPPKYKIKTLFDTSIAFSKNREKENFPSKYDAKITYYGGIDESKRISEHILDITPFYDLRFRPRKEMHHLVEEIKDLNRTQKSFQKEFDKYNDNFSRGLWIKNPVQLISNINQGPADVNDIIAKLNEFRILWEFVYLKEEEDINPFYTDIRNYFIIIGYQIISFSSYTALPIELNDILLEIGLKIQKLGRCDDYYDGWNPNIFKEFGNEIKELVNKTIENIKTIDS